MTCSNRLTPLALAALLSAPVAAFAQSQVSAPAPSSTAPTQASTAAGQSAQERVEQRIRQLHAELKITPAEEPQWNRFAATMRANAADMDRAFSERARQFGSMTAVQNMQSYVRLAEDHARRLQKLAPVFADLYNSMPQSQQRVADEVFRADAQRHVEKGPTAGRGQ
jgi:protein CpxP